MQRRAPPSFYHEDNSPRRQLDGPFPRSRTHAGEEGEHAVRGGGGEACFGRRERERGV